MIFGQPPKRDLPLISFNCIESRIFDIWAMHGIDVFNFNHELSQQLRNSYGEENGEVRFPTEEWEVLSLIQDIRRVND
jgi:hypothetical protein